jgi:hypothetical protein
MTLAILENNRAAADPRMPPAPDSLASTGLSLDFLAELVCKNLYYAGRQSQQEIAASARLPVSIVEEVVDFLRRERLIEVASTSTVLQRCYVLTDTGRSRAKDYLAQCQYKGPAPVTLESYERQVRLQAIANLVVTRKDMDRAFDGVVVSRRMLDRLGAAMNSGRAIFLYGPAGAGKSFIAERLVGLLQDDIYIPYALLIRDQIVRQFDPATHVASGGSGHGDGRWVRCRRPVVLMGGELTLDMLDLQFEQSARFYAASPQLKANNGLLVIDDLGRQKVSAQDLMNRWIVPLDRRIDYLALHTGEKLQIPFDVTVLFCTNMAPSDLADEAFLRRLRYKIHVGPLNESQYRQVSEQVCRSLGIPHDPAAIDRLIARFRDEQRPLLACTPRDLLAQLCDSARYEAAAVELSDESVAWAWRNYFVTPDTELSGKEPSHEKQ